MVSAASADPAVVASAVVVSAAVVSAAVVVEAVFEEQPARSAAVNVAAMIALIDFFRILFSSSTF